MSDGVGFFHGEGRFHLPHHHEGHVEPPARPPPARVNGEVVKIFCEARPDYNLAVRHHEVVLVPGNDNDPYQTWIKDESWSTKVKDSAGFPAFALVNRGTGKALRHAEAPEAPILLEEHEPNVLNEEILWTTGADIGHGYRAIRPVSDIHLNLDADHGSEKYGGVKDGNKVIFFKWKHEPNQHWKLERVEHHRDHHSRPHEHEYGRHDDRRSTFPEPERHSRSHERYDGQHEREFEHYGSPPHSHSHQGY